jgi:hypothetical protein
MYDMGEPILSPLGMKDEPGDSQEERVMDRPPTPSSVDPAATDANSDRHNAMLRFSLDKIDEGDFQDCGDTLVAAGISWRKSELIEGKVL